MTKYTFKDNNGRTFKRISKVAAKKLYNNGGKVALCPVKFNPCGFYYSAFIITKESQTNTPFQSLVNSFEFYNCQHSETGKYAAFYTVED